MQTLTTRFSLIQSCTFDFLVAWASIKVVVSIPASKISVIECIYMKHFIQYSVPSIKNLFLFYAIEDLGTNEIPYLWVYLEYCFYHSVDLIKEPRNRIAFQS